MRNGISGEIPVVAIGASAGGLEALQTLVDTIPVDGGLCYVVVQHLSPDHESILDQLLQTHTKLKVSQIKDGDEVLPDHIYLVPPGKLLNIENDRLMLDPIDRSGGLRTPIDHFFRSLADAKGRDAYCIILSGTGSDGSLGLKAVKSAGGFAIVQESNNARFPGMPDSAAATGVVDFVLRAEDIAPRLDEIVRHRYDLDSEGERENLRKEIEERLGQLTKILRDGEGHDFSDYKPGTLTRRIERRMMLLRIRTVENFLELLEENDKERQLLVQDFLIGVTHFFRDPEAFRSLRKKIVRPLLESDRESFRIWVPGCSTGEEVYSIAMTFMEEMDNVGERRQIQFFGTDIDSAALLHARDGVYSQSSVGTLTDKQKSSFFTQEGDHFRVNQYLRESCVFAPHNLIQDPPFSRLDLVSCRNLLIYLSTDLQKKVIPRFHFSLLKSGYMFLGPSEGLAGEDEFFECLDKTHRIFRKNTDVPVRYSPLSDPRPRSTKSPEQNFRQLAQDNRADAVVEISRETQAEQAFLRRYAQPFSLLSTAGDIIYLSEQMSKFIRPAKGVPSNEIEAFLTRELRVPVRSALDEARASENEVVNRNVVVEVDGDRRLYDIVACPLEGSPGQLLLTLQEVRIQGSDDLDVSLSQQASSNRDILEREVVSLRRQLAASQREHEVSNQELKSTNEELLSMNEELQSSNEELETSREELQSINEELETVNSELSENNMRLTRANSDLKNLFESTDIAVLFLDSQSCIRSFTPAATAFFGLKKRDVGRPIADLSSKINYKQLADDVINVERDLQTVEREITVDKTEETYALRMRPYRTTDDRLDGYVLTFFDISTRKKAEEQLKRNADALEKQYAELETLYDTIPVGLSLVDKDMRWLRINERLADINGFPASEHIGKKQAELIPDIDKKIVDAQKHVFETGKPIIGTEVTGFTPAAPEKERDWIVDYYPIYSGNEVFAIGTCVREVTKEKQLMRQLAANEARLKLALERNPLLLAEIDSKAVLLWTMGNLPGLPRSQDAGKTLSQLMDKEDAERLIGALSGGSSQFDFSIQHEGEEFTYGAFVETIGKKKNTKTYSVAFFDLSHRRQMEARQQILLDELQHRVKNTLATIGAIANFIKADSKDVDDFQKRLMARLTAISRTHDLLTVQNWGQAPLFDLIRAELSPFMRKGEKNISIVGQDLMLEPKEALGIGMAFHELATNAAKYGAFLKETGVVTVTVENDLNHKLYNRAVRWKETGGPKVKTPGNKAGFGSFLLQKVLAKDLDGKSNLTFETDGLKYELLLP